MDNDTTESKYTDIQEQITSTLQQSLGEVGGSSEYDLVVHEFIGMIEFLERMYINTILSMVGSFLTTVQSSNDKAFNEHLLSTIRQVLPTAGESTQQQLDEQYKRMVKNFGFPDPMAVKSHNENVAEEILKELGEDGG